MDLRQAILRELRSLKKANSLSFIKAQMELAFAAVLALSLTGCAPKVLNEDGAQALVKAALDKEHYIVSIQPLLSAMAQSDVDYNNTSAASPGYDFLVKKLLDGGIVKQDAQVNSYPVVSGSFKGINTCVPNSKYSNPEERLDFVLKNQNSSCSKVALNLELEPVPNSNRIGGYSDHVGRRPPLKASITPASTIHFSWLAGPGGSGEGLTFFYIERGQIAYLVGNGDYLYTGTATGMRIEAKTYQYSFTSKIQASSGELPVGSFEVGKISNLQLTLETRATANFAWRVSPDALGKVLLGTTVPNGIGTAEFAKKPDGTWVLAMLPALPHGQLQ